MTQEFTQYHRMVSTLARPVLARAADMPLPPMRAWEAPLALAAPAGAVLIGEPMDEPAVVDGCIRLAELAGASLIVGQPAMLRAPDGHGRSMYHPFALHLFLAAFRQQYEQMSDTGWAACEEWLSPAVSASRYVESFADSPPPMDEAATVLWHALCVYEHGLLMSRDTDIEWVDGVVHSILDQPNTTGSLLPQSAEDAIDLWMFQEMVALHALTNLALLSRRAAWSARVAKVAAHHMEHFQPDYTTSQPWGLMAFVWTKRTSYADQQMHDAQTYGEMGQVSLVSALLLSDAARAMRLFVAT